MHPNQSFERNEVYRYVAQLTGYLPEQLHVAHARLVRMFANEEVSPLTQIFTDSMWKEEFSDYHLRLFLAAYFREVFMRTDRKNLRQKYEKVRVMNGFIRTILPFVISITGSLQIERELNEQESGGPMSRRGIMLIPTTDITEPNEVLLRQNN